MSDAYLYAAARTPFGRFNGALAGVRPDELAATALTGLLDRAPDLDRAAIGDVCRAMRTVPARTTATSAGWRCRLQDCR